MSLNSRYRTLASPENRAVSGISDSASASLTIALRYPEIFGKCMAQSTASGIVSLMKLAKKGPGRHLKVYMDIGRYEADFHGTDLLSASRRIK